MTDIVRAFNPHEAAGYVPMEWIDLDLLGAVGLSVVHDNNMTQRVQLVVENDGVHTAVWLKADEALRLVRKLAEMAEFAVSDIPIDAFNQRGMIGP